MVFSKKRLGKMKKYATLWVLAVEAVRFVTEGDSVKFLPGSLSRSALPYFDRSRTPQAGSLWRVFRWNTSLPAERTRRLAVTIPMGRHRPAVSMGGTRLCPAMFISSLELRPISVGTWKPACRSVPPPPPPVKRWHPNHPPRPMQTPCRLAGSIGHGSRTVRLRTSASRVPDHAALNGLRYSAGWYSSSRGTARIVRLGLNRGLPC